MQAFNAAKYASGSVTVKLLDDIDSFATGFSRTDGVQFQSGDVTLDLSGHYIERYNNAAGTNVNKKAVFYVTGSAELTVMDSVGGGTVTVTGDPEIHGGKSNALLITGENSVTLSSGTYATKETNKRSILTAVGKVTDLLADGFRYTDSNGMDVAITEDGQGTDSDNVTVSDFGIKYISADGAEQKCTSFTEITDATTGDLSGWYAVTGTVNIDKGLGVTGGKTLNLILCDGAQLNLTRTLYMLRGSTINIYGQSGGTGTLIVESSACQPGIGIMLGFPEGTVTVNIYGGTVTAKTAEGAQPIGSVPALTTGKANVTIAKGLKCVKTDELNTAYAYDNTDGTSITITKCTEHKWLYTDITDDTHNQTCELCGTAETAAHSPARYKGTTNTHHVYCACGKDYATERHSFTFTPNNDGLTHKVSCAKCGEITNEAERHSFSNKIESGGRTWFACELCGNIRRKEICFTANRN